MQTQQEEEEDLSRESLSLLYVKVEKDRKIEMGWVWERERASNMCIYEGIRYVTSGYC